MPPYEVNVGKNSILPALVYTSVTNLTVVSYAVYRLLTLTVDEGGAKN